MKKHYLYTDMSLKHVFTVSLLSIGTLLFARGACHAQDLSDSIPMDTILLDDGSLYMGQIRDSLFNGTGKMIYSDGTIYNGQWENGLWQGNGELHFPDGDFYQGEFSRNEFNGTGTYHYSNGASYEGEWKDGRFNGAGRMKYADGSTYAGEWKDDVKEGLGVLYNAPDSILVKGYFHNDLFLTTSHEYYYDVKQGNISQIRPSASEEPKEQEYQTFLYTGLSYSTNQLLSLQLAIIRPTGPFIGLSAGVAFEQSNGIGRPSFDYYYPDPEYDPETGEYFHFPTEKVIYADWDEYMDEVLNERVYPKAQILVEAGWKWKLFALGGGAGVAFNSTIRNCMGGKGSPFKDGELYYREKLTGTGFAYRVFSDIAVKNDVSFRIGYGNREGLLMGLGICF